MEISRSGRFLYIAIFFLLSYSINAVSSEEWQPPNITPEMRQIADDIEANSISIKNSSIWVDKQIWNEGKFSAVGALVELRGPITKSDIPVVRTLLAPYLDKAYAKKHKLPECNGTTLSLRRHVAAAV